MAARTGSPLTREGRGLKHIGRKVLLLRQGGSPLTREGRGLKLHSYRLHLTQRSGSPLTREGRGLKLFLVGFPACFDEGSPVTRDGRGLKLRRRPGRPARRMDRPSAALNSHANSNCTSLPTPTLKVSHAKRVLFALDLLEALGCHPRATGPAALLKDSSSLYNCAAL